VAQAQGLIQPDGGRSAITSTTTAAAVQPELTDVQLARRAAAAAVAAAPATYTVRRGDSLSAIAGHLFGNPGKWPYLYDANRRVVGDNPDVIQVGAVLAARLGGTAAYGRVRVTASYHAVRHARSGDGDGLPRGGAYCKPNCWGDGDDDGYDLSHSPWQAAASYQGSGRHSYSSGRSVGSSERRSNSGGNYSRANYGSPGSFEACVIARESGGNSQVMNSSGHYGLYQFSSGTWQAYGGSASSFGHASASEQRQVFENAIQQGGQSNWSPYDGC
jgi:hypothetical protein